MANWAVIENGNITETYDSLPKNWRNISNLDASEKDQNSLKLFGWHSIVHQRLDYDDRIQTLEVGELVYDGKIVIQKYWIKNISTDDLYNSFISNLRNKRDALLKQSDYMCLPDILHTRNEQYKIDIFNYRQQLRDLTDDYPNNGTVYDFYAINWPIQPNLNDIHYIGN